MLTAPGKAWVTGKIQRELVRILKAGTGIREQGTENGLD
jgi:hypothetical protein